MDAASVVRGLLSGNSQAHSDIVSVFLLSFYSEVLCFEMLSVDP